MVSPVTQSIMITSMITPFFGVRETEEIGGQ